MTDNHIHRKSRQSQDMKAINGKLLDQFYAPRRAKSHIPNAYAEFATVTNSHEFHSIQIWRRSASGRPTTLYALTVEQLSSLVQVRDAKILKLIKKNRSLQQKLKSLVETGNGESAPEYSEPATKSHESNQSLQELQVGENNQSVQEPTDIQRRDEVIRILCRKLSIDDDEVLRRLSLPIDQVKSKAPNLRLIYIPMGGQVRRRQGTRRR